MQKSLIGSKSQTENMAEKKFTPNAPSQIGNMKRRQFMKAVCSTGILMATSSLPAVADDDPSVFPKRGGFERLSVSYATVHIGLKEPFSVMHISDTHLTAAYPHESDTKQQLHRIRTTTFGGRQEEALRDSLDWARKHVDYVIHTGDLIDWQSEANYDLVRKYLGDNVVCALGNHEFSPGMSKEEDTEASRQLSRDALQRVFPFDLGFHSQVVRGVNFIAMNDVYGTVNAEQVSRFNEEVERGLPIVLCMHVPFYTDDIWRATCRYWKDKEGVRFRTSVTKPSGGYRAQLDDVVTHDFILSLRQQPLLKAILCGHEHITVEDRFSPTAMEYVVGGNYMFHAREILFV